MISATTSMIDRQSPGPGWPPDLVESQLHQLSASGTCPGSMGGWMRNKSTPASATLFLNGASHMAGYLARPASAPPRPGAFDGHRWVHGVQHHLLIVDAGPELQQHSVSVPHINPARMHHQVTQYPAIGLKPSPCTALRYPRRDLVTNT
jgi:hypothetical protein